MANRYKKCKEPNPLVCKDCGSVATARQRIYDMDCKCGGSFVEQIPEPEPEPVKPPKPAKPPKPSKPPKPPRGGGECGCLHGSLPCDRICDDQARCPYCYNNGQGYPVLVHGATDEAYRRAREILVADASRAGRPRPMTAGVNKLPEEISPWMGLEPALAKEMAEIFPAPNPDIVVSRRLRKIAGWGKKKDGVRAADEKKTVGIGIPAEILYVTGMRYGDLVLISGWHNGLIRIVRIPEGENG